MNLFIFVTIDVRVRENDSTTTQDELAFFINTENNNEIVN